MYSGARIEDIGSFYLSARVAMWGEGLRADRPSLLRDMRILPDDTLDQLPPQQAPEGSFEGGLDTDGDGEPEVLIFSLAAHPREDLIVPFGEDGRVANEGVTEHRLPVRDDLLARPQGVFS